ncbi:MAG: histidine--tRNA ligase [Candidatus Melainabacteria bacterium]
MTMQKIQRPKGTQDIFGDESLVWQRVESVVRTLLTRARYREIRTPVFESTDLFKRGVGETTDIVHKEMYTFEKGDRSLTLRPEGTAGVVRAFIEQGLHRWPRPVRLYYMGPMFRYERPQAGRQRQFHQVGAEVFGMDTPECDAEVILLAMQLFEQLGLPGLTLQLNNMGTAACRQRFIAALKTRIEPHLSSMSEDDQIRFRENPLRMLDSKDPQAQAIFETPGFEAFLAEDFTDAGCQAHFQRLCAILDEAGVAYVRNPRLVRGLDYYTKTVFEITSTQLGAQNTVCAGGRYNNLVEHLGGPATPGVGWALGMERLVSLLPPVEASAPDYYLVSDQPVAAHRLARRLREQGATVEMDVSGKAFGKQLAQAGKAGAARVLILGESEAAAGQVTVKDFISGDQRTVSHDTL